VLKLVVVSFKNRLALKDDILVLTNKDILILLTI
jgi:hypothetical protein